MSGRKWNFNPGPSVMPVPALEKAKEALLDYDGTGIGIMETSHRSKEFGELYGKLQERMAKLLALPADRKILFFGGGANLQFSMIPMNLLPEGGHADYVNTGTWANKAIAAAQLVGKVDVVASSKNDEGKFPRSPRRRRSRLPRALSTCTCAPTTPSPGPSSTPGRTPRRCPSSWTCRRTSLAGSWTGRSSIWCTRGRRRTWDRQE